jgi:hypothetical protein
MPNYKCADCSKVSYNVPLILLQFLGTIIYLIISIRSTIILQENTLINIYFRKTGFFLMGVSGEANVSAVFIKILMNYLQIASVINELKF